VEEETKLPDWAIRSLAVLGAFAGAVLFVFLLHLLFEIEKWLPTPLIPVIQLLSFATLLYLLRDSLQPYKGRCRRAQTAFSQVAEAFERRRGSGSAQDLAARTDAVWAAIARSFAEVLRAAESSKKGEPRSQAPWQAAVQAASDALAEHEDAAHGLARDHLVSALGTVEAAELMGDAWRRGLDPLQVVRDKGIARPSLRYPLDLSLSVECLARAVAEARAVFSALADADRPGLEQRFDSFASYLNRAHIARRSVPELSAARNLDAEDALRAERELGKAAEQSKPLLVEIASRAS